MLAPLSRGVHPLAGGANALPSPIACPVGANRQSPIGNHCSRDVNFACKRSLIDDFRYPIGEVGWHKLPLAACYFFLSYSRCAIVKMNFDAPTAAPSASLGMLTILNRGVYPSAGGENAHTSPIANRQSPIGHPGLPRVIGDFRYPIFDRRSFNFYC